MTSFHCSWRNFLIFFAAQTHEIAHNQVTATWLRCGIKAWCDIDQPPHTVAEIVKGSEPIIGSRSPLEYYVQNLLQAWGQCFRCKSMTKKNAVCDLHTGNFLSQKGSNSRMVAHHGFFAPSVHIDPIMLRSIWCSAKIRFYSIILSKLALMFPWLTWFTTRWCDWLHSLFP